MLNEFLDLERWAQWFAGLEREFIFLLALPFVVAIVGLWSAWADKEEVEKDRDREAGALLASGERERHERRREDLGRVAPQE